MSEFDKVMDLIRHDFPAAVDYHVEDNDVHILDVTGRLIGMISTDGLTKYWNIMEEAV